MGYSLGEIGGRRVGYSVSATCDHPGCNVVINRGLGWCCGSWPEPTDHTCGGFFCPEHEHTHDCSADHTGVEVEGDGRSVASVVPS